MKMVENHPLTVLFILSISIITIIFWDFLALDKLFLFIDIGSDSIIVQYPEMVHLDRYLNEFGYPRTWSFYGGMGQNYYHAFHLSPIYFIDIVLSLFLRVGEKIVYVEVFKILFTVFTSYFIFKLHKAPCIACIFGAISLGFSGYMIVGSTWIAHSHYFLLFVFLILAFEILFLKKVWWPFIFAIYLTGFGPTLYFNGLFLIVYFIYRNLESGRTFNALIRTGLLIVVLTISGIALGADGFISGFINVLNSPRVSGSVSQNTVLETTSILTVSGWIEITTAFFRTLSSDLLGNGTNFSGYLNYLEAPLFYVGVLPIIIFPFHFLGQTRKTLAIQLIIPILLILILLLPYLRISIYQFQGNYYKSAVSIYGTFCLAFFSARSLTMVLKGYLPSKKIVIIFIICLFVLINYKYPGLPIQIDRLLGIYVSIFIGFLGLLLVELKKEAFKVSTILLLTLVGLIEITFNSMHSISNRTAMSHGEFYSKNGYYDDTIDAVNYLSSIDTTFYRIDKEYQSPQGRHIALNDAMVQGYFGTSSYSSFNQGNYINFLLETGAIKRSENATRWAKGLIGKPRLESIASVKYLLTKNETSGYERNGSASFIKKEGNVRILKHNFPLPFGFCYDKQITQEDFKKQDTHEKPEVLLKAFVAPEGQSMNQFKAITLDDSAKFSNEAYAELTAKLKEDTLRITSFNHDRIEGDINLQENKLLFFSIPFDPGWKATVNGENRELLKVNIGMTGLPLEPGNHKVILQYEPPFAKEGIIISRITLAIILIIILFQNKNRIRGYLIRS
ncbi:MAG: YfhO family protein [Cyclobacteriaceae bacterium]